MQLINGLMALSVALPLAEAAQALVKNNCQIPVYLWPVDIARRTPPMVTLQPGGSYSENYHTLASGGVSIKIAKTTTLSQDKITQFEYTLTGGFIWYDGSHVNCQGANCPFYSEGIFMEASDPTCPKRTCKPNEDCTGFYINYNDDINTLSCNPSADISFYLCSSSATGSSNSTSSSVVQSNTTATQPIAQTSVVEKSSAVVPIGSSDVLLESSTESTKSPVSSSIVAAASSPVAAAPTPSSASASPSVAPKSTMEAPEPLTSRRGPRFFSKIRARQGVLHPRDLHAHIRRHNHGRH